LDAVRIATLADALRLLDGGRQLYAAEHDVVAKLLDKDHYYVFKLRHLLATFDRVASRLRTQFT
jgi:hypothetical protein